MNNPTYDLSASGCTGATDDTLVAIQDRIHADGVLRNGKQLTRDDRRFVSAELLLRTDDRHHEGDILTWVTTGAGGSDFRSVDVRARDNSSWPVADLDVRAEGAGESRACVAVDVGKTQEQIRCEQDQASSNGPALPGGRTCEDL